MQLCFLRAHLDSIEVPKVLGLGRMDKSHCLLQDLLPFKGRVLSSASLGDLSKTLGKMPKVGFSWVTLSLERKQ